jgi:hypothetical protein
MSGTPRVRTAALAVAIPAAVAGGLLAQTVSAGGADAAVVTKATLDGTHLRVKGTVAPGTSFISIESTTSAIGARAKGNGTFEAQSDSFTAPDCFITVRDGNSPDKTVRLDRCTPSVTPVPANPAPPSGSCVITPQAPATLTKGTMSAFTFHATGCDPSGPLNYDVVAGAIPTGMTVGTFQNSETGNIIGTPSIRRTYRFTIEVVDAAGATDQENFTINVV